MMRRAANGSSCTQIRLLSVPERSGTDFAIIPYQNELAREWSRSNDGQEPDDLLISIHPTGVCRSMLCGSAPRQRASGTPRTTPRSPFLKPKSLRPPQIWARGSASNRPVDRDLDDEGRGRRPEPIRWPVIFFLGWQTQRETRPIHGHLTSRTRRLGAVLGAFATLVSCARERAAGSRAGLQRAWRSARPGRAPVCRSPSSTSRPLTMT
jgi:hypothetical protein